MESRVSVSNLRNYLDKMDEYLKHDKVFDYDKEAITELADTYLKRQIMRLILLKQPMNLSEMQFHLDFPHFTH